MEQQSVHARYTAGTEELVNFLCDSCETILGETEWKNRIGKLPNGFLYKLPKRMFIPAAEIIFSASTLPMPITGLFLNGVATTIRLRESQNIRLRPRPGLTGEAKIIAEHEYKKHRDFNRLLKDVQSQLRGRSRCPDHDAIWHRNSENSGLNTAGAKVSHDQSLPRGSNSESLTEEPQPSLGDLLKCSFLELRRMQGCLSTIAVQYTKHQMSLSAAGVAFSIGCTFLPNHTDTVVSHVRKNPSSTSEKESETLQSVGLTEHLMNEWSTFTKQNELNPEMILRDCTTVRCPRIYRAAQKYSIAAVHTMIEHWTLFNTPSPTIDHFDVLRESGDLPYYPKLFTPQSSDMEFKWELETCRFLYREFLRWATLGVSDKHHANLPLDHLTRTFLDVFRQNGKCTWVTMGLAGLARFHIMLGSDHGRPWNDRDLYHERALTLIADFLEQPDVEEDFKHLMGQVIYTIGNCRYDPLRSTSALVKMSHRQKRLRQIQRDKGKGNLQKVHPWAVVPGEFILLKNNPAWLGVQQYVVMLEFQETALAYVSESAAIRLAAIIYYALVRAKGLFLDWNDMALVVAYQGHRVFPFGRSTSKSKKPFTRAWRQAVAYVQSPVSFKQSPFLDCLKHVLRATEEKGTSVYENALKNLKRCILRCGRENAPGIDEAYNHKMMSTLIKLLKKEDLHGYFDYIGLDSRCIDLIENISSICWRHFPLAENEDPEQLQHVAKIFETLYILEADPPFPQETIDRARRVREEVVMAFENFLKVDGSKGLDEAYKLSGLHRQATSVHSLQTRKLRGHVCSTTYIDEDFPNDGLLAEPHTD